MLARTLAGCGPPSEAEAQGGPRARLTGEAEVTAAIDPRSAQSGQDRLADALAEEAGAEDGEAGTAARAGAGASTAITSGDEEPTVLGVDLPVYDPSGTALRSFHTALRRAAMGEGQARIVAYGASHVASDFATGTLRRALQQEFGDAGHGFVLPAHPWPHYRHLDVTVESNHRLWDAQRVRVGTGEVGLYGLAGVSVTAESARAFGRVVTGSQHASRFELFYLERPDGGAIDVRIDDRPVGRVRTRGAEARAGYALFTAPDGPHTFEIRARGDGPVTVFGVAVERETPGVIVDTLGINGARAAAQLLWQEELWREHLRRRAPDLVVLAYGTNESGDDDQPIETYERDLRTVVARVRAAAPAASCLLIGPSDRPVANRDGTFAERPRTAMVIDAQRRVSAELGCAFFDLVAFGGGPMHMVEWASLEPAWAQRDHVHYTFRGYERLGQVLHGALLSGYEGPTALVAASASSSATARASAGSSATARP